MKKSKTPAPLSAERFERELNALQRAHRAGHINNRQFNNKYVALVTRFRKNK